MASSLTRGELAALARCVSRYAGMQAHPKLPAHMRDHDPDRTMRKARRAIAKLSGNAPDIPVPAQPPRRTEPHGFLYTGQPPTTDASRPAPVLTVDALWQVREGERTDGRVVFVRCENRHVVWLDGEWRQCGTTDPRAWSPYRDVP